MKCPSCNYVSHDYLDACPSCGGDWLAFKTEIGLHVRPPGMVLDLSEAAANRAGVATPDIAMASPGTPDAMPTLEFVEIEDEPGTGP